MTPKIQGYRKYNLTFNTRKKPKTAFYREAYKSMDGQVLSLDNHLEIRVVFLPSPTPDKDSMRIGTHWFLCDSQSHKIPPSLRPQFFQASSRIYYTYLDCVHLPVLLLSPKTGRILWSTQLILTAHNAKQRDRALAIHAQIVIKTVYTINVNGHKAVMKNETDKVAYLWCGKSQKKYTYQLILEACLTNRSQYSNACSHLRIAA